MFDIVMIPCFIIKKITPEPLCGFTGLCIHICTSLDSIVNLSVNWSINSLFVDFWLKIDFWQVECFLPFLLIFVHKNKHISKVQSFL